MVFWTVPPYVFEIGSSVYGGRSSKATIFVVVEMANRPSGTGSGKTICLDGRCLRADRRRELNKDVDRACGRQISDLHARRRRRGQRAGSGARHDVGQLNTGSIAAASGELHIEGARNEGAGIVGHCRLVDGIPQPSTAGGLQGATLRATTPVNGSCAMAMPTSGATGTSRIKAAAGYLPSGGLTTVWADGVVLDAPLALACSLDLPDRAHRLVISAASASQ